MSDNGVARESNKAVREGSASKRAAILDAAGELFVSDGVDRTSMDAIAVRAQVSKRTIYDYYGDKHSLFVAVVEEHGRALWEMVDEVIRRYLSEEAGIRTRPDLEAALVSTAVEIVGITVGSSSYAAFIKLVTSEDLTSSESERVLSDRMPEDAMGERFAALGRAGLLDVEKPRIAAEHFTALTVLLVINNRVGVAPCPSDHDTIVEGVRAFLRAYAPQ